MESKIAKSVDDYPPTEQQWRLGEWFAAHKRIPLPPECKQSRLKWWQWLRSHVTQIDREDARAASVDYNLEFERDSPVSVIGALKYAVTVDKPNKIDQAKQLILSGTHPYIVQDIHSLTEKELNDVTRTVESENPEFEIDWGSV